MKFIVASTIVALATQAVASESWSDREMCRAATKTYFWLKEMPTDGPDQGAFMGFKSAKNNYYTCRIDGNIADFKWVNQSSEKMRSRSTTLDVSGGTLTVNTDMKTESFTKN